MVVNLITYGRLLQENRKVIGGLIFVLIISSAFTSVAYATHVPRTTHGIGSLEIRTDFGFEKYSPGGVTFTNPNDVIYVSGSIDSITDCTHTGKINDFGFLYSDIYTTPSGSVSDGTFLVDLDPAGEGNTVGGLSARYPNDPDGEPIATLPPTGKLKDEQTYDIVYDHCQDGIYNADEDVLFEKAFTVSLQKTDNGLLEAQPDTFFKVSHLKSAARTEYVIAKAVQKAVDAAAAALVEKISAAIAARCIALAIESNASPKFTEIGCKYMVGLLPVVATFVYGVKVSPITNWVKHASGLIADPPNSDYKHLLEISLPSVPSYTFPISSIQSLSHDTAINLNNEATLIEALTRSLELTQGADLDKNPKWLVLHLKEIAKYSNLLLNQTIITDAAMTSEIQALRSDSNQLTKENIQKITEDQSLLKNSGFNLTELRALKNLGFTEQEIEQIEKDYTTFDPPSNSKLADNLQGIIDSHAQFRSSLIELVDAARKGSGAIIKDLPYLNFDFPVSDAGGPYSAGVNSSVLLNGSGSIGGSKENNITKFEWDLDSDGLFKDAVGPVVPATFSTPSKGYIALKVTNDKGYSDIDYAQLEVINQNLAPTINNFSPSEPITIVNSNSSKRFDISYSDPNGDIPVIRWFLDRHQVASNIDHFVFNPADSDVGIHNLQVNVSDLKVPPGIASKNWQVSVLMSDNDNDGWHENVDCTDNDPTINPSMKEILFNGIDDDCNPNTLDDNAEPPTVSNRTVNIIVNNPLNFLLLGNDDGIIPLNYSIINNPKHGVLTNITRVDDRTMSGIYLPNTDFVGNDSFTFRANDGKFESNLGFINVTVLTPNAPTAFSQNISINEDTFANLTLKGKVANGDKLIFRTRGHLGQFSSLSLNGTLVNTENPCFDCVIPSIGPETAKLDYIPNPNFSGNETTTFYVTDSLQASGTDGLINIHIKPINDAPSVINRTARAFGNDSSTIAFRGSDVDGDKITFSINAPPKHGTLSNITENTITYTANNGFFGSDSFTYSASDGQLSSNTGNVTVFVVPTNQSKPPTFRNGDLFLSAGGVTWLDDDGTVLGTFGLKSGMATGLAFNSEGKLYVTSFGFNPSGNPNLVATILSNNGTIVGGINASVQESPPVAEAIVIAANGDIYTSNKFHISESILKFDKDGNFVRSFNAGDLPGLRGGTDWIDLAADQCTLFYTTEDHNVKRYDVCSDLQLPDFAPKLPKAPKDSTLTGGVIAYALRLLPEGGAIVAYSDRIMKLDSSGNIVKIYDTPDDTDYFFSLNLDPDGKSFWAANIFGNGIYKFDISSGKIIKHLYNGLNNDAITGVVIKGEKTAALTNTPPRPFDQVVKANKTGSLNINISAADALGDKLTFSIVKGPSHGTLSSIINTNDTNASVAYTPNEGFSGNDIFTFKANDGKVDSTGVGTVSIIVDHDPIAQNDIASTLQSQSVSIPILVNDTDEDQDVLSIASVNTSSLLGDLRVNPDETITYTPFSNFTGTERFDYTVSDRRGGKDIGQVTVNINSKNTAPVANSQVLNITKNTPFNITLTGGDLNNDTITYFRALGPANGFINKFNSTTGLLQYTPLRNFLGQDSLTFQVGDGKVRSLPATVDITVTDDGTNDPPIATSERTFTERNKPVLIDVLLNDKDPNGDPLTIANITGPISGGAVINQNSTITFTPLRNFIGPDVFIYNVTDGKGGSDIAQVIVDVNGPETNSPTVGDQSLSTKKNTPLNITLIGTSSGSPLTFSIVDNVAHGNLSEILPINNTSVSTKYTPTFNFTGTDLFTYKANNGTIDSNIGTVTITVNGTTTANALPIARDDSANTNEDTPVLIPVLANDSDADGDNLVIDSINVPAINGSTIINPNSTITYSPNSNFFGVDGFNYTITDGRGGNSVAHVSLNVNSVNDPPIANNDTATTQQEKSVAIQVLLNDTDVEGDTLAVSAITTQPSNGSILINNNGSVTYTPQTGFFGTDSFDYQVSDNNGGNSIANVIVKVNQANNANQPPIAVGDVATTNEDTSINLNIIANDTDPDNDPLTVTSITTAPQNGISTINNNNNTVTYSPNSNFNGQDSFGYDISDNRGGIASAQVIVQVLPVNDNPIAIADSVVTDEKVSVLIDVLANDSDVDNDNLSISQVTTPNNGTAVIETSKVKYTPQAGFDGTDNFEYTLSDGNGGTATSTVEVHVKPVNEQPIGIDGSVSLNEDSSVQIKLNATDSDSDPLTYSINTQPTHGSLTNLNSNTGILTFNPNSNFNGPDSFKFQVSDGSLESNIATVSVNVKPVNDPPTAKDDTASADEGITISINNLLSNDNDLDGDALSIIQVSTPQHGIVAINTNKTSIAYTSSIGFAGQDSFDYTISDGNGGTATGRVTVTVRLVNHAPVAENQNLVTDVNKQIEITLKASDPDQLDLLTFVKVTDPANGIIAGFDSKTGILSYIPNNGFVGSDSFTFKVIDNHNAESNAATVSIQMNALPNSPPVANDQSATTNQNTPKDIVLTGKDPNTGDTITFVIVSNPSNGQISNFDKSTGKLTYSPKTGFFGTDSFRFKTTDNHGAESNTATVSINVKQIIINHPPDCTKAFASIAELWPPNHKMTSVTIRNVIDPDRDPLTVKIARILQDEPVNGLGDGDTSPDADGIGTDVAQLRSERSGTGDGRVYHIYFTASDGKENGKCESEVTVSVPHDQSHKVIDSGPKYDSTAKVSDKSIVKNDDQKVQTKELAGQQQQNEPDSRQLQEPQKNTENSQNAKPVKYWLTNLGDTKKLLPLALGNFTVNNIEKAVSVLNIENNNHNIYDNLGAELLTGKLNIKSGVSSCTSIKEVIRYADEKLSSVSFHGSGTVDQALPNLVTKDMARAHATLIQFNSHGCTIPMPPAYLYSVPHIFEILLVHPQYLLMN